MASKIYNYKVVERLLSNLLKIILRMELTEISFNFYKIQFTPVKSKETLRQKDILSEIINACTPKYIDNKVYLIDRFESRVSNERRELFISYITYNHNEKRYKGTLALIRNGKKPFLKPKESFQLVPLDSLEVGSLAETTHFFIDISTDKIYLCIEFNHLGPRVSDIEYYFRHLGKTYLNITKKTEIEVYLNRSIKEVLNNLKDVLSFDLKIEPHKIAYIDKTVSQTYFTSMNNLSDKLKPKFIALKAYYQTQGRGLEHDSSSGRTFIQKMLSSFSTGHTNLDSFESFILEYTDNNDQIEKINLIKDQIKIIKNIDLSIVIKNRDWYNLIKTDFDNFINSI